VGWVVVVVVVVVEVMVGPSVICNSRAGLTTPKKSRCCGLCETGKKSGDDTPHHTLPHVFRKAPSSLGTRRRQQQQQQTTDNRHRLGEKSGGGRRQGARRIGIKRFKMIHHTEKHPSINNLPKERVPKKEG